MTATAAPTRYSLYMRPWLVLVLTVAWLLLVAEAALYGLLWVLENGP